MIMGRSLEIKHTDVFERNWTAYNDPDIRYIINQGGSRSSKTISIIQCLIIIALQNKVKISITRKTLASCKTLQDDFFNLMREYDLYKRDSHNKSLNNYIFDNGSEIEFIGVSDTMKLRGKKRDILFCNEINELDKEEWLQLMLRTSGKVFTDYNPSDDDHWIYELINEKNSILIKSTYKDNPFLERQQVEFIENLINTDENYYKIYALGEIPTSSSRIYNHFKQYVDEPRVIDYCYGLDFGYNHPVAMVKCQFENNRVYVRELIYKTGLTTTDLIREINMMGVERSKVIYCDSARPDIIEELRRAGYQAMSSDKNVKKGIDTIKSTEIFIHHESLNLLKEYKLYNWKVEKQSNRIIDEPVKLFDDALDAMRYAIHTHRGRTTIKVTDRFFY